MKTKSFPFTPKFMTMRSFSDAKGLMAECSRCHSVRMLPKGKTALTSICTACMKELELDLKLRDKTSQRGSQRSCAILEPYRGIVDFY